jgi:hypothetical protein
MASNQSNASRAAAGFLSKAIPAMRIAIGVSAFGAPGLFVRGLALREAEDPAAAFLARMAGARDLLLGVGALAARQDARRLWLALGLAADAADATAAALALRSGARGRGMLISLAAALGAVGLGAWALADR